MGTRDRCLLGEPNCRRPFWPRRRAVRLTAPTRPWYVRVLESAGHNLFVRASEETVKPVFFDILVATRNGCLLGKPHRRRPFRRGPAWPHRCAVRRPATTRLWYVRVLNAAGEKCVFGVSTNRHRDWVDTGGLRFHAIFDPADMEDAPVESKTRTHHRPLRSGRRTAVRRGGARVGRTGRCRDNLARRQPSFLPSSES